MIERTADAEQVLSTLLSSLPGIAYRCLVDERWTLTFVSEGAFELTGYTPDQLLHNHTIALGDLIHPQDRAMVHAAVADALEAHRQFQITYRIRTADGTEKWVWEQGAGLYNGDDTVAEITGLILDTTERMRAEEALIARERYLRAILDSEPECVKVINPDGNIHDINPAGVAMLEAESEAQLIGQPVLPFILPPHQAAFKALHENVLKGGRGSLEYEMAGLRGTRRWLTAHCVPLRDAKYEIIGMLSISGDTTQRRRAEVALRESEARFRALIEQSSDVITVVDAGGTIVYQSASVQRILGYSPDENIGKSGFDLIHPRDVQGLRTALQQSMTTPGEPVSGQFRFRHKNGSWRTLESTARNLLSDPRINGVIINSRDVTDAIELEERLRQSQKMEAVGALAGGIAHDFNNLLTGIAGYAQFLSENTTGTARADALEILRSAERAAALTRQLLSFSRKQVLQPQTIDLNVSVKQLHPLLRRLITEDIAIDVDLAPEPLWVEADPNQIEQILLNLTLNARDAMPKGGSLRISTEAVNGGCARLHVEDTGVGIPANIQSRVFEPFFTTKGPTIGTGLGLATVHAIVQQSNGSIWLRSKPGAGTTFTVELPLVAAPKRQEAAAVDHYQHGNGEVILLVEDEPNVRTLALRSLERSGYTVLAAADGEAALEMVRARNEPIDLVITDVVMPGMSGKEFVRQLTELRPESCVLYISGYAEEEIVHRGSLEPGIEFLSKPFTPRQLSAKVRDVLARRRK